MANSFPQGNDELLAALDAERLPKREPNQPLRERDEALYRGMIDELIRRGIYPKETIEGNHNTVYEMVDGWGARWYLWRGALECPHCKADLRDQRTGPPFKREIGMYDRGLDRTTHFACPDCKKKL